MFLKVKTIKKKKVNFDGKNCLPVYTLLDLDSPCSDLS